MINTPVLFLIFNRIETTKKVFERIALAKPKFLYIASDGPRDNKHDEKQLVSNVRSWVLDNITWDCVVNTLFRDANLGCGLAVSSAIDWFFNNEELGIIIEDDCLVDLSFFSYAEELLIKYRNNDKITSICSSNTIGYFGERNESYFFSKYSMIWGWATWRRAWNNYDYNIKNWPEVKQKKWLRNVDKSLSFNLYWTHVFDTCFNKKVNTWDFQWNYASFLNESFSIVPTVNLVRNIGIGFGETHKVNTIYSTFIENEIKFPLVHPEIIAYNIVADTLLKNKIFSFSITEYFYVFIKNNFFVKQILKFLRMYNIISKRNN